MRAGLLVLVGILIGFFAGRNTGSSSVTALREDFCRTQKEVLLSTDKSNRSVREGMLFFQGKLGVTAESTNILSANADAMKARDKAVGAWFEACRENTR